MSEATLDPGSYLASPAADWSRERPFQIAFALSVVAHALLIAFVPGLRSVPADAPSVLQVQIVPDEVAPPAQRPRETPVSVAQKREPQVPEPPPERQLVAPKPQIVPEPVLPSAPEPAVQHAPEPRVPELRAVQPELPPPPRPEVRALPRPEPEPEVVVPRVQPQAEPRPLPKAEAAPEPKVERTPPPPPVARMEPRSEPRPETLPPPRPPQIEPRITEPQAQAPQDVPRPVAPRPQPAIAPPETRPAPPQGSEPVAPVASAPTPPAELVKPRPVAPTIDEQAQGRLLLSFSQSISNKIKRHLKYPPPAQRRGWEGTAEVLLQIAADGNVAAISLGKSSGHAILDEEALNMVRRASPLPTAPADLRGRALVVTVPIVFRLQNS